MFMLSVASIEIFVLSVESIELFVLSVASIESCVVCGEHVLEDQKLSVQNKLDGESRSNIVECFDVDPFQGLDTEYLQANF